MITPFPTLEAHLSPVLEISPTMTQSPTLAPTVTLGPTPCRYSARVQITNESGFISQFREPQKWSVRAEKPGGDYSRPGNFTSGANVYKTEKLGDSWGGVDRNQYGVFPDISLELSYDKDEYILQGKNLRICNYINDQSDDQECRDGFYTLDDTKTSGADLNIINNVPIGCNIKVIGGFWFKKVPTGNLNFKVELSAGGDLSKNILLNTADFNINDNDIGGSVTLTGLNNSYTNTFTYSAQNHVVNTTFKDIPAGQYSLSYNINKRGVANVYINEVESATWCKDEPNTRGKKKLKWKKEPALKSETSLFNEVGQTMNEVIITANKTSTTRVVFNIGDKVAVTSHEACKDCGDDWRISDDKWPHGRYICHARGPKYNDNCDAIQQPSDFFRDCKGAGPPDPGRGGSGCWCTNNNDCSKAGGKVEIASGQNYCRETGDVVCCLGGAKPVAEMGGANRCCNNDADCNNFFHDGSKCTGTNRDCGSSKSCVVPPTPQPTSSGGGGSGGVKPVPTINFPQCDRAGGICVAQNICGYENNFKSLGAKDCKGGDSCCTHIKVGPDFVPKCGKPIAIGGYGGQCKSSCRQGVFNENGKEMLEVAIGNGECAQIGLQNCCVKTERIPGRGGVVVPTQSPYKCEQEGGKCIDKTESCPTGYPNKWSANGCPGGSQLSSCCMPAYPTATSMPKPPTPYPCQTWGGVCVDKSESCPSTLPQERTQGCGSRAKCCVKTIPIPSPTSMPKTCFDADGFCAASQNECGVSHEKSRLPGCPKESPVCCTLKGEYSCGLRFGGTYQILGKLPQSILNMNPKIRLEIHALPNPLYLNNITSGSFGTVLTKEAYIGQEVHLTAILELPNGIWYELYSKTVFIGTLCNMKLNIIIPAELQTSSYCNVATPGENCGNKCDTNRGEKCLGESGLCCYYDPNRLTPIPAPPTTTPIPCEQQGGKCIDKTDNCPVYLPNKWSANGCPGGSQLSSCCMPERPTPTPKYQCERESGVCVDNTESCPASYPNRSTQGCSNQEHQVCCKKDQSSLSCLESGGYCVADQHECSISDLPSSDPKCPSVRPVCCGDREFPCKNIIKGTYQIVGFPKSILDMNPRIKLIVDNGSDVILPNMTSGGFVTSSEQPLGSQQQLFFMLEIPSISNDSLYLTYSEFTLGSSKA